MRFFQPLLRSPRVRRVVVLTVAMAPFAYELREQLNESESIQVLFPIAEMQRVEKQWTMTSASAAHRINNLKLSTPGLTFVSVDSTVSDPTDQLYQQIGAVRVSADTPELLACIEVVPLSPNGIEIRFKKDAPKITSGHLLTELLLGHEAHVNSVDASGGGVVVVEENVLVADCAHADLKLSLRGHGELFVSAPSTDINVNRLSLSVAGSGRLQFEAAELVAMDDVLLQVAGSGHANLFAKSKLHASMIKSSIAGSGHTSTFSNSLKADKLKSSIAGYGEAKHFGPGHANIQRVSITGSGKVSSKEIVSENATVRVIGAGDATLDVRESLEASCKGWGVVRYVNAPPKTVKTHSLSLKKARASERKPSHEDELMARSAPVPERKHAFDDIEVEFDPKTVREKGGSCDVFGAIEALKGAISSKRIEVSVGESEKNSERELRKERREKEREER